MKLGLISLLSLLGIGVFAQGCGGAFSNPGPAVFKAPAAKLAAPLKSKAKPPAFVGTTPAESIDDLVILEGRAVVDLRRESGDDKDYTVLPSCGPLEVWDTGAGRKLWSVERSPQCDDQIINAKTWITTLGNEGKNRTLSTFALDNGAVLAKVSVDARTFAVASGDNAIVTVEGGAGKQKVTLRDGEKLAPKWTLALDEKALVTTVVPLPNSTLVFGESVTAIDTTSGAKLRASSFGPNSVVYDVVKGTNAVYASVVRNKTERSLSRVALDGSIVWTKPINGVVETLTKNQILVTHERDVTALTIADGGTAWSAKLPSEVSGNVVATGETLFLVPHQKGVAALDAATGTIRFDVAPLPVTGDRFADHLSLLADGSLAILEGAHGIAGIEIANEGKTRYALPVRSLPYVHRAARIAEAAGKAPKEGYSALVRAQASQQADLKSLSDMSGGGMMMANLQVSTASINAMTAMGQAKFDCLNASLHARRAQHARIALEQMKLDDASPFILRPISWSTGRGFLAVEKMTGGFVEIVTGPPDVYEDAYRPASVAAWIPASSTLLGFSEGLDAGQWKMSTERVPAQLVARSLVGYRVDVAALTPAAEYPQRSVVPLGSFETNIAAK